MPLARFAMITHGFSAAGFARFDAIVFVRANGRGELAPDALEAEENATRLAMRDTVYDRCKRPQSTPQCPCIGATKRAVKRPFRDRELALTSPAFRTDEIAMH